MSLDAEELSQRLKKLSNSLQGFPKNPTVDEVHALRTRARRVESVLEALEMDSAGNEKKLLADLKSIRSRAGKVRDMDVFTSYVVGLGAREEMHCIVRLLHHLGFERHRHANELHSLVQHDAAELRHRLKLSRRSMDSLVNEFANKKADLQRNGNRHEERSPLHAVSVALRLSKELSAVHQLGPNNLHAYRIEVKRLRYVLEMADGDNGKQQPFIDELKRVQDAIGEWHDWLALSGIAQDVLRHHKNCSGVRKLNETAHRKYTQALHITEQMRHRYLSVSSGAAKSPKSRKQKAAGGLSVIGAARKF